MPGLVLLVSALTSITPLSDLVRIDSTAPFLVPEGQALVVTAVGQAAPTFFSEEAPFDLTQIAVNVSVLFDGGSVLTAQLSEAIMVELAPPINSSLLPIPPGLVAQGGTFVSVFATPEAQQVPLTDAVPQGLILGYLEEQAGTCVKDHVRVRAFQMVLIEEGIDYTVPTGRTFVLTGLARSDSVLTPTFLHATTGEVLATGDTRSKIGIQINGVDVLSGLVGLGRFNGYSICSPVSGIASLYRAGHSPSVLEVPLGIAAQPGSVVSVAEQSIIGATEVVSQPSGPCYQLKATLEDTSCRGIALGYLEDVPPSVSIAATAVTIPESQRLLAVTLNVSWNITSEVIVPLIFSGTAEPILDYRVRKLSSVVIPCGADQITIPIHIVDDTAAEGLETLTITLGQPQNATLGVSSAIVVEITDND